MPKRFSCNSTRTESKRMVRPFVKISRAQYEELDRLREEKKEPLSELIRKAPSYFTKKKVHSNGVFPSFLPACTKDQYKTVTAYFLQQDWNMLETLSKNTGRCKAELLREAVDDYLRQSP